MLKSDENRIVVNDFIQGEPLSEENLDKTLDIVTEFNKRYKATQDIVSDKDNNHNILNENPDRIRLSCPDKTIWLYTGFRWEEIFNGFEYTKSDFRHCFPSTKIRWNQIIKRREILSVCDILVDGRYIDSQRNVSAEWKGSNNQRVISVQKSLQQGEVVLYCD